MHPFQLAILRFVSQEMQRLVRDHYEIDSRAGLQFEVSTWDVCAGRDVEVTEAAYPFLAPLLDIVSVVVVEAGRWHYRVLASDWR